MIDNAEGVYVLPAPDGVGKPLVVDLAKIVKAQSRIAEIATVNPHTGQGLMAFFLDCWRDLHDTHGRVVEHRDRTRDALARAKAEALLGADATIKAKGGKPSADLREAVVVLDGDVREAQDRVHEVEAVLSWVKGRVQEFEAAWRSVRTIVESIRQPPPRLHGDGPAPEAFGGGDREIREAFQPQDDVALPAGLIGVVDYNRY